jgi:ferrochelatase
VADQPVPYDAVLVASFGGPEGPDQVIPFLQNVLKGRNVPAARMQQVAEHYYRFGGISPINGQNRSLVAALTEELARVGLDLPVYWGNRNWHPMLADTVQQMAADGVRKALAFVTSAYASYSGCRQYLEDLARARAEVGPTAPAIDKLRVFYNHPGFITPMAQHLKDALAERTGRTHVVFTAHSIPLSMAATSDYVHQLTEASRLVAEAVQLDQPWQLVFQSRSGPPTQPWLEPDIGAHLRALADRGKRGGNGDTVIVVPIGFISDHMEVAFDLDVEARQLASDLGLGFVRTPTVGTDPAFVTMIRQLIEERLDPSTPKLALGDDGPYHDTCPAGCCPPPSRG